MNSCATPVRPRELWNSFPPIRMKERLGFLRMRNTRKWSRPVKASRPGRMFNLVVAFESAPDKHGNQLGRGIAESSFHHFADYNWDTDLGCPSFLVEPPGDGYKRNPHALNDIKTYASNAASWLAGR